MHGEAYPNVDFPSARKFDLGEFTFASGLQNAAALK